MGRGGSAAPFVSRSRCGIIILKNQAVFPIHPYSYITTSAKGLSKAMRAAFSYAEACLLGAGYDTAGEPRRAGRGPAPRAAWGGPGLGPGGPRRGSRLRIPGKPERGRPRRLFRGGSGIRRKKTALAQRRFVVYAASGLPKAVKIAIGVDCLRFISLTEGKAGFGFVAGVQGFKLHALPGL